MSPVDYKSIHFIQSAHFANRFVIPIISSLKENGYAVDYTVPLKEKCKLGNPEYLPVDCLDCEVSPNPISSLLILARLLVFLYRKKPTAVHCHTTKGSILPLVASFLIGTRVRVYHNHGIAYVGYRNILGKLLIILEKLNCHIATEITVVNPAHKERLVADAVALRNKIKVIGYGSACGIEIPNCPLEDRSNCKNPSEHPLRFGFLGRPVVRKGLPLLLSVWNKAGFSKQGSTLTVAGCTQKECLPDVDRAPNGVQFLGFLDDPEAFYSKIDILILPSFHEGTPYVLLEAGIRNKILISSKFAGYEHLFSNPQNGLLFEVGNEVELEESLREAHKLSVHDRNLMLKRVKSDYSRKFSRRFYMLAFLKFQKELCENNTKNTLSSPRTRDDKERVLGEDKYFSQGQGSHE